MNQIQEAWGKHSGAMALNDPAPTESKAVQMWVWISVVVLVGAAVWGAVGLFRPLPGKSLCSAVVGLGLLSSTAGILFIRRGFWGGLMLAVTCLVAGFVIEIAGTKLGWLFSPYEHSPNLGPGILGVPWAIPLGWFITLHTAAALTGFFPVAWLPELLRRKQGVRGFLVGSLFRALVDTAAWIGFDLGYDPLLTKMGMWVWREPGTYFGVPIHNYFGMISCGFWVYVLMRVQEWRWPRRVAGVGVGWAAVTVYLTFGGLIVVNSIAGGLPGPAFVCGCLVGAFAVLGASSLLARETREEP